MSDLLYTVFTDIEPEYEEEFNEWQNVEHCPSLLTLPGYHCVSRYASMDVKHRFANFWHIESKSCFDNPKRKELCDTPWGTKLSPYRHRHIDFYVQDDGIEADYASSETDVRTKYLVIDTYSDENDNQYKLTERYREKLNMLRQLFAVSDARIYHGYHGLGTAENYVLYYINTDDEAQLDSVVLQQIESVMPQQYVRRERFRAMAFYLPGQNAEKKKQKYSMLVLSKYIPGKEKEYVDWYCGQHVHDLMRIPGFVGFRFYKFAENQIYGSLEDQQYRYMMLWDWETDDVDSIYKEIVNRKADGRTQFSDCFDRKTTTIIMLPVTDYFTEEQVRSLTTQEVLEVVKPDHSLK